LTAPLSVIVLLPFTGGSPKTTREVKPVWKPRRNDPPWPRRQPIPVDQREALKRRAEQLRHATRPQVETMLENARAMRAAMRERRTGVPLIVV
jgi:hypothetical protein